MARAIRVRTREQEGKVEVFIKIKHPMHTGMVKDKTTKKLIPAHFIKKIMVEHNGKLVADADLGIGVSTDPLIGLRLEKAKNGDPIKISWQDNKGESGSHTEKVEL